MPIKFQFIDSSTTWYGIAKQLTYALINLGLEPSAEGISICYVNDIGEIDHDSGKPITPENRMPLKRGIESKADFTFYSQKSCAKFFEDKHNAFYLPPAVNTNIFNADPNSDRPIDVGFVGKKYPSAIRNEFFNALENQKEFNFVHKENIYFKDVADFYGRCKIVVNDSQANELNMRIFEATASGALLITKGIPYLETAFNILSMSELLTYWSGSYKGMLEIINEYLTPAFTEKRIAIATRGYERTLKNHSYNNRALFIKTKLENYVKTKSN